MWSLKTASTRSRAQLDGGNRTRRGISDSATVSDGRERDLNAKYKSTSITTFGGDVGITTSTKFPNRQKLKATYLDRRTATDLNAPRPLAVRRSSDYSADWTLYGGFGWAKVPTRQGAQHATRNTALCFPAKVHPAEAASCMQLLSQPAQEVTAHIAGCSESSPGARRADRFVEGMETL